jgi:hypothetical protein
LCDVVCRGVVLCGFVAWRDFSGFRKVTKRRWTMR